MTLRSGSDPVSHAINPMSLDGRTVLVTGASAGIGRETAILLSQLGARLVLVARDAQRLEETRCKLAGGNHRIATVDLADTAGIPLWFTAMASQSGPLHGLVHSAGLGAILPLRATSLHKFEEIMAINVTAAFVLAKCFRQPSTRAVQASIVLISSVMGAVAQPAHSAYCTSKTALLGLTRALAIELAREQIRVNCVMPGSLDAGMGATPDAVGEANHAELVRKHPLGLGQPRDVAHAVAFLLADSARWITGATLAVDGGYTAH